MRVPAVAPELFTCGANSSLTAPTREGSSGGLQGHEKVSAATAAVQPLAQHAAAADVPSVRHAATAAFAPEPAAHLPCTVPELQRQAADSVAALEAARVALHLARQHLDAAQLAPELVEEVWIWAAPGSAEWQLEPQSLTQLMKKFRGRAGAEAHICRAGGDGQWGKPAALHAVLQDTPAVIALLAATPAVERAVKEEERSRAWVDDVLFRLRRALQGLLADTAQMDLQQTLAAKWSVVAPPPTAASAPPAASPTMAPLSEVEKAVASSHISAASLLYSDACPAGCTAASLLAALGALRHKAAAARAAAEAVRPGAARELLSALVRADGLTLTSKAWFWEAAGAVHGPYAAWELRAWCAQGQMPVFMQVTYQQRPDCVVFVHEVFEALAPVAQPAAAAAASGQAVQQQQEGQQGQQQQGQQGQHGQQRQQQQPGQQGGQRQQHGFAPDRQQWVSKAVKVQVLKHLRESIRGVWSVWADEWVSGWVEQQQAEEAAKERRRQEAAERMQADLDRIMGVGAAGREGEEGEGAGVTAGQECGGAGVGDASRWGAPPPDGQAASSGGSREPEPGPAEDRPQQSQRAGGSAPAAGQNGHLDVGDGPATAGASPESVKAHKHRHQRQQLATSGPTSHAPTSGGTATTTKPAPLTIKLTPRPAQPASHASTSASHHHHHRHHSDHASPRAPNGTPHHHHNHHHHHTADSAPRAANGPVPGSYPQAAFPAPSSAPPAASTGAAVAVDVAASLPALPRSSHGGDPRRAMHAAAGARPSNLPATTAQPGGSRGATFIPGVGRAADAQPASTSTGSSGAPAAMAGVGVRAPGVQAVVQGSQPRVGGEQQPRHQQQPQQVPAADAAPLALSAEHAVEGGRPGGAGKPGANAAAASGGGDAASSGLATVVPPAMGLEASVADGTSSSNGDARPAGGSALAVAVPSVAADAAPAAVALAPARKVPVFRFAAAVNKRREEEARRKQEEEEKRMREEEEKRRVEEEERRRREEEERRIEEERRRVEEEARRKEEEKRRAEEEARRKEEEERRRREEERRRVEEEQRRLEEEARQRAEAERRRLEEAEAQRKREEEEEKRRQEEEKRRLEEEARQREEEERRRLEEEEAQRKREEAERRKAERQRKAEEKKRQTEEKKRQREEQAQRRREQAEQKKREEAEQREREEAEQREREQAEQRQSEEEARRKEEEEQRRHEVEERSRREEAERQEREGSRGAETVGQQWMDLEPGGLAGESSIRQQGSGQQQQQQEDGEGEEIGRGSAAHGGLLKRRNDPVEQARRPKQAKARQEAGPRVAAGGAGTESARGRSPRRRADGEGEEEDRASSSASAASPSPPSSSSEPSMSSASPSSRRLPKAAQRRAAGAGSSGRLSSLQGRPWQRRGRGGSRGGASGSSRRAGPAAAAARPPAAALERSGSGPDNAVLRELLKLGAFDSGAFAAAPPRRRAAVAADAALTAGRAGGEGAPAAAGEAAWQRDSDRQRARTGAEAGPSSRLPLSSLQRRPGVGAARHPLAGPRSTWPLPLGSHVGGKRRRGRELEEDQPGAQLSRPGRGRGRAAKRPGAVGGGAAQEPSCARLVTYGAFREAEAEARRRRLAAAAKPPRGGAKAAAAAAAAAAAVTAAAAAAAAAEQSILAAQGGGGARRAGRNGNLSLGLARKQQDVLGASVTDSAKWKHITARSKQLKFGRSKMHGWGMYAAQVIEPEEFVMEYIGELLRLSLSDVRQRHYREANLDDYMFRIDAEWVVDATRKGGAARFINHSCDPNCYTKIIVVDGRKHVCIYAKRRIERGEELCYDYKFQYEDDEDLKVPCNCGARNCTGWMC